MLTMQLAISAYKHEGIERCVNVLMPPQPWLSYIISWQCPEGELPEQLRRDDVQVVTLDGKGLSRNRNNALRHCTADIVLSTDDDLTYDLSALEKVRSFLEAHPELDFVLYKYSGPRVYPKETIFYKENEPLGFSSASIELAIRRKSIEDKNIRYDERFGINSGRYSAGEDSIFMMTLRRYGLKGAFIPLVVCNHEGETTGERKVTDPRVILADGIFIGWQYRVSAILRIPLRAWRIARSGRWPAWKSLFWLTRGYIESIFIRRPWKQ